MNFDDMPQDAWVTWSKVKELEARITALECHKNICDHPRVEEDFYSLLEQNKIIQENSRDNIHWRVAKFIFVSQNKSEVENLSVVLGYEDIKAKNYSLSAMQYFEVKIEYVEITEEDYKFKLNAFEEDLNSLFIESKTIENEINNNLKSLKYE